MAIELRDGASLAEVQHYIHELEAMHGWLEVDLVNTCFLMGEEVGELFGAVRRYERLFAQAEAPPKTLEERKAHVAEELVDVLNYLCAVANRLDIPLEEAFRTKNARNQQRTWE